MPTPLESRAALQLLTGTAVVTTLDVAARVSGTAEMRRLALLDTLPGVVDYYSDGSAALAADFYEERRELALVASSFVARPVVVDRTVQLRGAIAWATEPWFADLDNIEQVSGRLAEVIQMDVARPYRDTITANRRYDPDSVGWRRITRGGCRFCRMLADRGAVYSKETARFAAHTNCHCTAEPVFAGQPVGPEASPMQYVASQRKRTPEQQATLHAYLDTYYPGR